MIASERIDLYCSIRTFHNIGVGVMVTLIVILSLIVQTPSMSQFAQTVRPFVSSIFVLDVTFVIFLFLLIARSSQERAIVADMTSPIALGIVALGFCLPCIQVFTDTINILLYYPLWCLLVVIPVWYLWIGQSAYWDKETSSVSSEGQARQALLDKLIASSSSLSLFLILYWVSIVARIGVGTLRFDLLPIFASGLSLLLLTIHLDIKVHWLERYYSKRETLTSLIACICVLMFLVVWFRRLDDWTSFFTEHIFLLLIYINLIPAYLAMLNDWPSRLLLASVMIASLPLIILAITQLAQDAGVVAAFRDWAAMHLEQINAGIAWFLGAMAGSAFFSAIVWFVTNSKRKKHPSSLNTVEIDQILAVRSMTKPIAEAIMRERPFQSAEDVATRVDGIGPRRLEALSEKFTIP